MNEDTYAGLAAAERAYRATKDAIISGEFKPGRLLSANLIAEMLDVSRTPAREAFVRLEGEGLLDLIPRRGAVVLPMSRTEARDVIDVRHALEVSAVRRLAQMTKVDERLALARAALEAQGELFVAGDADGFVVEDENFHLALVVASGNEVASRMYETLRDRQRRMIHAADPEIAELAIFLQDHRQLLELAERGDVDGFSALHWEHLVTTHRTLLDDDPRFLRVGESEVARQPTRTKAEPSSL